MRIELKGLIAAVVAGLAVLGATFGVSALVVRSQASPRQSHHVGRTPSAAKPTPINLAFVAQGHTFYTQNCASCHGVNGVGGYGPGLHREDMSDAQIALTIKNGVKGKMPGFAGTYNDTQVQALVAYIRSLT